MDEVPSPEPALDAPPGAELVLGVYLPRPRGEEALRRLLLAHVPLLRREGLAAPTPWSLLRTADGRYLELFAWLPGPAAARAHLNPRVADHWCAIGEVAEIVPLTGLTQVYPRLANVPALPPEDLPII